MALSWFEVVVRNHDLVHFDKSWNVPPVLDRESNLGEMFFGNVVCLYFNQKTGIAPQMERMIFLFGYFTVLLSKAILTTRLNRDLGG